MLQHKWSMCSSVPQVTVRINEGNRTGKLCFLHHFVNSVFDGVVGREMMILKYRVAMEGNSGIVTVKLGGSQNRWEINPKSPWVLGSEP